jgi:hypothetical protein
LISRTTVRSENTGQHCHESQGANNEELSSKVVAKERNNEGVSDGKPATHFWHHF